MSRRAVIVIVLGGCAPSSAAPVAPNPPVIDVAIDATPAAPPSERPAPKPQSETDATALDREGDLDIRESGLGVVDNVVGKGAEAILGSRVSVHYTGRLADGTQFDSSIDRGQPITFELGGALMIAGFEEGIVGMRVGGKRRLIIPPHLGYGARGAPPKVPPDAIVEFDLELVDVQ